MRKLLLTLFLLLGMLGAKAQSDLVVFNNNPNMTYVAGETMTFTVMVTNNGPQAALGVVTYFAIPAGITIPTGITKFWWTGSNGSAGTNVALNNTVPTLGVNQTVSYTVNIKIPDDYTADLEDVLVTYNTRSDINVVKTDNQATYTPNTDVVYTITVTNNGPEATTKGVQITDNIPTGITQFSWTGSNGSSGNNVNLVNNTGILSVGQVVTYTVTLHVPTAFTGNLVNAASYIATVTDPTPTCTQCTDTDVPNTGANLVVTTTNNQTTYTPGGTAVYTVTVTNNGPNDAAGVNVAVPVPAGTTIASWTGSNGSSGTGAVANAVGALANGASVTYTVTVAIPAAKTGALTLAATATATTADPDTSCTNCSDTDFDASSADIVTTKTLGSGTAYTAGTDAIYTITVHNNGPTAAQNVVVSDVVPAGLSAANATWVGNGTFGSGNLLNTIPLLENGATVTYTFTIPVPSNYDQTANIVNQVTVTSDTPDPVPACTTCTVTATPNPLANLVTLKTNGQTSYLADSGTTYTISVTNPGPSDAYNVVVSDNKPYYIDVMTWEGNGAGGSGSFTNTIPVLPAGQSVIYTVNIYIPADYADFVGTLTNTAVVTSGTPDPLPACPTCIDSDTPRGIFVTTSNDQYSVPELIEDVLIDVNCVGVDNVTWSTGSNFGTSNGIAYFHANNSSFPIQEGVVLTCGNAVPASGVPGVDGPNTNILSNSPGWGGDAEIQTYVPGTNNDASWIKFNFIPVSDSFSFNYLFASEEYGTPSFECTFTDVFAFILTDLDTGGSTPVNLAVLPGTNITVGVTTVHLGGAGCSPANATYFGQYNTGAAAATAPINFNGQTVIMQASATVIPNHTYSIKLAIANGGDHAYNSAVFIEAGSFDIGQPTLPEDITLGNQALLLCYGDSYELEAVVNNDDMLTKWQKDGEWILDDNGDFVDTESITVTEPGTYTVMGYFASNPDCFISDDIIIDFYPEIMAGEPNDLDACSVTNNGVVTGVFDLTQNNEVLLNGMDAELHPIKYYANAQDAAEGFPTITTPATYSSADNHVITVTVEDYDTSCLVTKTFVLNLIDCNVPLTPVENMFVCEAAPYNEFEIFDLTSQNAVLLNQLTDLTQYTVTFHNSQDDANTGNNAIDSPETYNGTTETIYVRVERVDNPAAFGTTSFDLIVTPQPVIEDVADVTACNSYVLPELTVGSYYTQANGQGNLVQPGTQITQSQTVYIFAQNGEAPYTCSDAASYNVTIFVTPVIAQPADVQACEGYSLPALTVGNYFTGANGTGTQLFADDIIDQTQLIHIYAATGNAEITCSADVSFTVTISTPPVVPNPTPLEDCDYTLGDANTTNDFSAAFNLNDAGNEVINGQTGLTVSYYTSQAGAINGTNAGLITAAQAAGYYHASTTDEAPLYIRVVETGDTTNCATVVPLQLIVHPTPVIPVITEYVLCDDNNSPDMVEVFDLTTKDIEADVNPELNNTVTYYTSQADAVANTNAIANPAAYTSTTTAQANQQTIYVRVENEFGCFRTSSFTLVVNPLPVVITPTDPFLACEETPGQGLFDLDAIQPVVTGGAAGFTASYYTSQDDADQGINFLATPYLSPNATIYVRVINDLTGCAETTTAQLEVLPAPIAPEVPALEECDFNNDNAAIFNINTALDYILSYMGGAVTLTVHETIQDATFEANAIPVSELAAYQNVFAYTTNGVQTLYIRVEGAGTTCFDIAELQLIVHPVPVAATPAEPYQLCDNGASDTDGQAVFNLTTYATEVLDGMSPAQYSVAYFTSFAAAVAQDGPITTPANYTSPSATVYIRVTNNATGCYDIVELELIVNPLPVVTNPTPLSVCDDNIPNNESEVFDLTSKIDEITNGELGLNVTFYHTYANAQAGTNAIPEEDTVAYTNSQAVETLFVRVTNDITGCYRIVLLDVRVEPLPTIQEPTQDDLTVCDTNGEGVGTFNLTELVEGLINNGGADLTIHFYESATDAANGLNEIPNPASYQNIIPFSQPIYIVVENGTTGCQSNVYTFTLIVEPAPQAPALPNLVACDDTDNDDQDAHMHTNLAQQDQVIYDALDLDTPAEQATVIIHYFTSEANANAGAPRITNPLTYNAANGQVIWVRVEDAVTECYSISSFTVIINAPVDVIQPTPLVVCNEALPNDATAIFDLTTKNTEILGPLGIGMGNTVTYYTTSANAQAGTNPISAANAQAYTNTSNPQTLFVVVTTPAGCKSYTTLTIRVLPLPVPNFNPAALTECDDDAVAGTEDFNLTQAAADILANDSLSVLSYYPTEADANAGTNEILTPATYNSATGSVWVKVAARTTNATDPVCYQLVELQLIVNPLPATGTIAPYAICEPDTDGFATFDFNTHLDELLGATANTDDYTVTFYYDLAAYNAGTPLPYIYTNQVATHQVVYVHAVNDVTGCENFVNLDLYVEEQALANPVTQATLDTYFDICDTDGTNDGFEEFDLTQATADVIGTQTPVANYTVTYYETEADAQAGTNAIATPEAYTNTTALVQTIWVRIINNTTITGCPSFTSFNVVVEQLAEPVITTPDNNHTICVDFTTGDNLTTLVLDSGITTAGATFKWFLDGVEVTVDPASATFEAFEPGSYTVEVTGPAPNFCVSGLSAAFVVTQSGPASIIGDTGYVVSNAFSDTQTITVLTQGYGEYQYSLYEDGPWQNSNVFTNVPAGPQTIYIRDNKTDNPCDVLILENVSIIDYPHYFTPNGDGYHETWNIIGLENYPTARIYIFDRYGKLLKQVSPESGIDGGWDGTFNGKPMPADDYWFTVTYPDGNLVKEFKAHFTLKR